MKNYATTCAAKLRHRDRVGALIAARKAGTPHVSPYHCANCGGWRLGHSTGHDLKAEFQGRRRQR